MENAASVETPASTETAAAPTATQAIQTAEVSASVSSSGSPEAAPPSDTDAVAAQAEAALEDLEWDGETDIPHAGKFPKLFDSIRSRLKALKEKADENELFDRLLKDPEEKTSKELEELRAFKKSWEETQAQEKERQETEAWEKTVAEEVPDIYEFAGEDGKFPALERYLQLVHEKGLDKEEAALLVRAKFSLGKKEETPIAATVEEVDDADEDPPAKTVPKSVSAMSRPGPQPGPVVRPTLTTWEEVEKKYRRGS